MTTRVLAGFAAAVLSSCLLVPAALADTKVAGKWHADLGGGVAMTMTVSPDGGWSSDTIQNRTVVRHLEGTYRQTEGEDRADGQHQPEGSQARMRPDNEAGTIVFTPTRAEGGKAETETDRYELDRAGRELRLTSEGDTMVFRRR